MTPATLCARVDDGAVNGGAKSSLRPCAMTDAHSCEERLPPGDKRRAGQVRGAVGTFEFFAVFGTGRRCGASTRVTGRPTGWRAAAHSPHS